MAVFKKHLSKMGHKGTIKINRGKGSQMAPASSPVISNPFQANLNDYSKAVPSAPPMMGPTDDMSMDGD